MKLKRSAPPKTRPPRPPRGRRFWIGLAFLYLLAAGIGAFLGRMIVTDLPEIDQLRGYRPNIASKVYDARGEPVYQFAQERRVLLPYREIPKVMIDAILAVEDPRFFRHKGIDMLGIARAFLHNLQAGKIVEGGSTITQQLSRLLFLHPKQTIERKVKEMILALNIERNFTKEEVLALYLNQVYFGRGHYGIEAASQFYFGHSARTLSLAEAALLAGVPQNAAMNSPLSKPKRARRRRNHVLNRMVTEGWLAPAAAEKIKVEPLRVVEHRPQRTGGGYFIEEIRRAVLKEYGEQMLYKGGLEVHCTMDQRLQAAAARALGQGLRELDKRQGWRGPVTSLIQEGVEDLAAYQDETWDPPVVAGGRARGVVTKRRKGQVTVRVGEYTGTVGPEQMAWIGRESQRPDRVLKVGDLAWFTVTAVDAEQRTVTLTLDQEPRVEGALVAIEVGTGAVRALVGGYDFRRSEFNRATQAMRQVGSAFKPLYYAAALERGWKATDRRVDRPIIFVDPWTKAEYAPRNYYQQFYGLVTVRKALEMSYNVFSVEVLNELGFKPTIDFIRRFGLTAPLPPYPSLALGAAEVSPLEMTAAYSAFPNHGVWVKPHLVRQVFDREGNLLAKAQPVIQEVLTVETAFIMTHLLRGVVERGTAQAARGLPAVAGKTGTMDDYTDAWFIGFSPELVVGVWVGFDKKETLGAGEAGGRAALPIWQAFMEAIGAGQEGAFRPPVGVSMVPVDRTTGFLATIDTGCAEILLEAFPKGSVPTRLCGPLEHFRAGLPYCLQTFELTPDRVVRIPLSDLTRIVMSRECGLRLSPTGDALLLPGAQDAASRVALEILPDPPETAPVGPPPGSTTTVGLEGEQQAPPPEEEELDPEEARKKLLIPGTYLDGKLILAISTD